MDNTPTTDMNREEGETEHFSWVKGGTIGSGATGTVYLGIDTASGTLMAVKQLTLPARAATVAAIDILKGLEHEHIARVLRISADHEHLSVFLEYVPGGSVADLLEKYGPFEEPLAKTFVRQVLRALAYLHAQGVVHGAIRGTHILVGNEGAVKLCGFGRARRVGSVAAAAAEYDVFWTAPEAVFASALASGKADVWAVGCLAILMLTGAHPWPALEPAQVVAKMRARGVPNLPSDVTPECAAFLAEVFVYDVDDRPSTEAAERHVWFRSE